MRRLVKAALAVLYRAEAADNVQRVPTANPAGIVRRIYRRFLRGIALQGEIINLAAISKLGVVSSKHMAA